MIPALNSKNNPVRNLWQKFVKGELNSEQLQIEIAFWVIKNLDGYCYQVEPVKTQALTEYQNMEGIQKKSLTKERVDYLLNEKKTWEVKKRGLRVENWSRYVNLNKYKSILIKSGNSVFAEKIDPAIHEHRQNGVHNYFNS